MIGDAQLLPCASHPDVEQSPSLLVAAPFKLVGTEQQNVRSVEPLGAMDGREPHGTRRLLGQQKARLDPLSLEPRGQALHGGPRETEHEDVVGRGPQVESYLDPRLCEPARHGQRRVAMNLGRWPVTQSAVGRDVIVRLFASHVRAGIQLADHPVGGVQDGSRVPVVHAQHPGVAHDLDTKLPPADLALVNILG